MSIAPDSLIDAAQAAFLQDGVSISAASCGAHPFPSVCRVLACSVAEVRRQLTVMAASPRAQELMVTTGADGMPNIAYLSQVQYVDHDHVAWFHQFSNKTCQNILARPLARTAFRMPA